MKISIIAAMAANRVIGAKNGLPWHLPEDLGHFKRLTLGHHILMGRKTYESIGRPLPGRVSVVISGTVSFPGALCARSLEEALRLCPDEEVFFIGGGEIYRQAMPIADRLYLTEIGKAFEGDTFFPEIDPSTWVEVAREKHFGAFEYHFVTYERREGLTPRTLQVAESR